MTLVDEINARVFDRVSLGRIDEIVENEASTVSALDLKASAGRSGIRDPELTRAPQLVSDTNEAQSDLKHLFEVLADGQSRLSRLQAREPIVDSRHSDEESESGPAALERLRSLHKQLESLLQCSNYLKTLAEIEQLRLALCTTLAETGS